jgi:hypothetical protein
MCDSELNCAQCVTKKCFFGHLQNDSTVCVSQRNEVQGWYHFIVDPGDVGVCPFQPAEPEVTTDAWVNLTRAGKSASSASSELKTASFRLLPPLLIIKMIFCFFVSATIISCIYMPIMFLFVMWKSYPHLKLVFLALGRCFGWIWRAARRRRGEEFENDPLVGFGEPPRLRRIVPNDRFGALARDMALEML